HWWRCAAAVIATSHCSLIRSPTRPRPLPTPFPYTTLFRSLPYAAPALWNIAGIVAMVAAGTWLANRALPLDAQLHRVSLALAWEIGKHTSELQSRSDIVCRLLLEKKKQNHQHPHDTSVSDR